MISTYVQVHRITPEEEQYNNFNKHRIHTWNANHGNIYCILDCRVRKGVDGMKFSPSSWSTKPAQLATFHWLNTYGGGGLGTGRCKEQ